MEAVQEKIKMAIDIIASIPVTGDGQEKATAAKGILREAYKLAGQPPKSESAEEEAKTDGGQDNG